MHVTQRLANKHSPGKRTGKRVRKVGNDKRQILITEMQSASMSQQSCLVQHGGQVAGKQMGKVTVLALSSTIFHSHDALEKAGGCPRARLKTCSKALADH
jgi:hypothetical protein